VDPDDDDIQDILDLMNQYFDPDDLLTNTPKYTYRNENRYPGGSLVVQYDVVNGRIDKCSISGDFLGVEPINGLTAVIEGLPYTHTNVCNALAGVDLNRYLGGITLTELTGCMFE
jgi:lipoate-protein ligase A